MLRSLTTAAVVMAVIASVTIAAGVALPTTAGAVTTFVVNSTLDEVDDDPGDNLCRTAVGTCTLRAAVQQANSSTDMSTIVLAPGAVYPLTLKNAGGLSEDGGATGDLDLRAPAILQGNGATIDAAGLEADGQVGGWGDRVIHTLPAGPSDRVTIERAVLTGGSPELLGGGGLLAHAPTTLDRSLVHNNSSIGGGGVLVHGSATGSVISQSIVVANDGSPNAGKGGGVRVNSGVALSILWSTFAGNAASDHNGDSLWLATSSSVTMTGSIFDAKPSGVACALLGSKTSGGHNLAKDATCSLIGTEDLPSTPPDLDQDLYLLAPSNASAAVNSGGTDCPATDVFGHPRPQGNACERGAVEVGFRVTSTSDAPDSDLSDNRCISTVADHKCTLRAAVQQASATAGPDTILLAPDSVYLLTEKNVGGVSEDTGATGDLDLVGPATIVGNGATVDASQLDIDGIPGGWGDRAIHTIGTEPVYIERVTVTGGAPELLGGGGVLAHAPTRLDRSLVRNNRSAGGGGVLIHGTASGSAISQSIILANDGSLNGGKGGGVRVNSGAALTIDWSTISTNLASGANGSSVWLATSSSLTMAGSIFTTQAGGVSCALLGTKTSGGNNLAADTSCGLTGTNDAQNTDPMLTPMSFNSVPAEGSPAVDSGGIGCPATDYLGTSRPVHGPCDRGAVETSYVAAWLADVAARKHTALLWNTTLPTNVSGGTEILHRNNNHRLSKAYASYILGNQTVADAAIGEIEQQWESESCDATLPNTAYKASCFPGLKTLDPAPALGGYPFRSDEGPSRFVFSLLFRLEAIEAPTTPAFANSPKRSVVQGWIRQYVDRCNFNEEFAFGTWTDRGSENHRLTRIAQCTLGLYVLRYTPGYNATSGASYDAGLHWTLWVPKATELLRAMANAGILGEQNYDGYMSTSLDMILNLRDFPIVTDDPTVQAATEDLRRVAGGFLDLAWHDLAQSYNAATHTLGTTGNRHYMPGPDKQDGDPEWVQTDYTDPPQRIMIHLLRVYGWDTGSPRYSAVAASSDYVPQSVSRLVALKVGKSYTYAAIRPGRSCGNWIPQGGKHVCSGEGYPLPADTQHGILSKVTVNDAFMIGATTYEPGYTHNKAFAQNLWYSANVNALDTGVGDTSNHLTVSSLAEFHDGELHTDFAGINGAVQGDVMIAARDRKIAVPWFSASDLGANDGRLQAPPSRGMRVWIGKGAMRRNLEGPVNGWYFSKVSVMKEGVDTDVAYAAIRFATEPTIVYDKNDDAQELRVAGSTSCASGQELCCPSPSQVPGAPDCWSPVVIQMGRPGSGAGRYIDFDDFKEKVGQASYAYAPIGGVMTVTYRSPFGDTVRMARQEPLPGTTASKPEIGASISSLAPVDTEPAKALLSPYLEMDWQSNHATLRGPHGLLTAAITVDVS